MIVSELNNPISTLTFEEVQLYDCYWRLDDFPLHEYPAFQYKTLTQVGQVHLIKDYSANEIDDILLKDGFEKGREFDLPPPKKEINWLSKNVVWDVPTY